MLAGQQGRGGSRAALKSGGHMPDTVDGRGLGLGARQTRSDAPATASASPPDLLPLVYQSLKELARQRMALERPGHTLQATALVHEAYLRLVGARGVRWAGRVQFY